MRKEIVVSVGHRETRVAMVEDGVLAELKLEREKAVLGNVYKGTVQNVVGGLDAAFVDCGLDRNVFLHVSDAVLEEPSKKMLRRKMDSFPRISEVLQPGQEILMQVTKGSVGSKGPRAIRRVSLPGRYLVLMVQGGAKVGVSRKIADEKERSRLRDLGEKVRPEGMGIIIRTRAAGTAPIQDFSGRNPPYLTSEAVDLLTSRGIRHLIVDLPSVDREQDGGTTPNHRAFWSPQPGDKRTDATITELAHVPDDAPDGLYLLALHVAPMRSDAAPSRPMVYPIIDGPHAA